MVRKRTIGPKAFAAVTIVVAALLGALILPYTVVSPARPRRDSLLSAPRQVTSDAKRSAEVAAHHGAVAKLPSVPRQATADATARAQVVANYEKLPLVFEANQGQTDTQVKFLSHGPGYTLFLTPADAVFSLMPSKTASLPARPGKVPTAAARPMRASALRIRLAGANPRPQIQGRDELRGKSNYLLGDDPKKWRTNVPNYARVEYSNIYPGVNLIYYGHQGQLEDDFEVAPGANPRTICLEISGAKKIRIDRAGNAVLTVPGAQVILKAPSIYEEPSGAGGPRREITGHYVFKARNQIGFDLGAYDRTQRVVIDPTLVYSTYLGGNGLDDARAIAVDASGNAYLTGETESSNFPVSIPPINPPGYQSTCPSSCDINAVAFVTKIDTTQSGDDSLVYSTYLGPVNDPTFTFTVGNAIAVDSSGEAVIAGSTNSAKFPIFPSVGAVVDGTYQSQPSGSTPAGSAFVFKLSANGSSPIFSTYLGGTGIDQAYGVALDATGDVYVVGDTSTPNLATPGVFSQGATLNSGSFAAFVTELNSTAGSYFYYAYLNGGSANAVALDDLGDAYVVGNASSAIFPTTSNAYQTAFAGASNGTLDAFFSVISSGGTSLQYSTFLAGSGGGSATGTGVAVNPATGVAYMTGSSGGDVSLTGGEEFPTTPDAIGAAAQACGTPTAKFIPCPSMFVASIDPSKAGKASLSYSTYLGGIYPNVGPFGDSANAVAVDSAGDAFITGETSSTDFPLPNVPLGPNPIQSQPPCPLAALSSCFATSAFLVELSPDLSSITYSTYLGNPSTFNSSGQSTFSPTVTGFGIALDDSGNAYVAGGANPASLQTTTNAFQPSAPSKAASSNSGFLIEIGTGTSSADLSISGSASPNPVAVNGTLTYTLTVTNNGPSEATGVTLTDTLPAGASFQNGSISSGGTCANASGIVTCSIGSLENTATATVTLVVTAPATAGSSINTATVSANQTDPNLTNNTIVLEVSVTLPVDLSITKKAPSVGTINQNLTYTITVTNSSTANSASNVTVTDPLPPGVNFETESVSQGNCTNPAVGGTGMVSCNLGTLTASATATVSLTVTPTVVSPALANTATVAADQANSNPSNSSTATVNVQEPSSVNVNVFERIHVADAPGALDAALAPVSETILVTDTPGALDAALAPVSETIQVTDTPGALDAALAPVSETIHVTDIPGTSFPVPDLTLTMTSLTAQGTEYLATFTITNTGGATANNVSVTVAALITVDTILLPPPLPPLILPHTTNPSTPLPISLGNIGPGSSMIIKIDYPINSLDRPDLRAEIRIRGTFDGGSVSGNFKTVLP